MTNKRLIRAATRERVREVLRHVGREEFVRTVTRKSVDLNGKIVVCGSSPASEWDVVEEEARRIYARLTKRPKRRAK